MLTGRTTGIAGIVFVGIVYVGDVGDVGTTTMGKDWVGNTGILITGSNANMGAGLGDSVFFTESSLFNDTFNVKEVFPKSVTLS